MGSFRTHRWRLLLVAVVLRLALPAPAATQSADVAVIVHRDVPVDSLTMPELRRLVLGDREFWPGSLRVTLLIHAPISNERSVILRVVCQMTEAQFRQHWIGKVFRADAAVAPKIVYSTEMAVDMSTRIPGAITFVDASKATRNMKVVRIDGKMPGDRDYPLR